MRNLCAVLALCLLLTACGGEDPEAEQLLNQIENMDKNAAKAQVKVTVSGMVAAYDAFVAAAPKAASAEEYAGSIQDLAKAVKAGWTNLKKVESGIDEQAAETLIEGPLSAAIERMDKAMEATMPKWVESDAVQAALKELMDAGG
jgi:hypothetical protein